MEKISPVGLDLAKAVFQVHAIAEAGTVLVRRTLRRSQVLAFFARLAPCRVGLEACGSAHAWAREIAALGHTVRIMPPASVKPLRLAPQVRRRRCRSVLRGGVPADHALRADQNRCTAGRRDGAQNPRGAGAAAGPGQQCAARPHGRTWRCRAPGQDQPRQAAGGPRRSQRYQPARCGPHRAAGPGGADPGPDRTSRAARPGGGGCRQGRHGRPPPDVHSRRWPDHCRHRQGGGARSGQLSQRT
jgi:hypothetical protein